MARMVRKQIYIEQKQEDALKEKSRQLSISEAQLIREGINYIISKGFTYKDSTAWLREKKFIQSLIKKGAIKGKRRWKREKLYDRKISRRY